MSGLSIDEDEELLTQYASKKDAIAFSELVRRYGGMVVAVARRVTGSMEEAEDIAQGVFLDLAKNCGKVRESVAGYLHCAARRRALNARREDATRRRHERAAQMNSPASSAHGELQGMVDEAIDKLPEELREAVVMHFLQGCSQEEAAQRMGVSQTTVSRRIEAGVVELRRTLRSRDIGESALGGALVGMGPAAVTPKLMGAMNKIGLSGVGAKPVQGGMLLKVGAGIGVAAAVAGGISIYGMSGNPAVRSPAGVTVAATAPASAPLPPQHRRNPGGERKNGRLPDGCGTLSGRCT